MPQLFLKEEKEKKTTIPLISCYHSAVCSEDQHLLFSRKYGSKVIS